MESNVFNMNRFWSFLKSDFNAFISRYGITLLVLSTMAVTTDVFNGLFSSILTGHWIGITVPFRLLLFMIFSVVVVMTAPAKLYGHLTDRKEGSAYLMLPVSKLEKYISMILITGILVPLAFGLIYLGLDIMVCKFDKSCGQSMFSMIFFTDFKSLIASSLAAPEIQEWGMYTNSITSVFTPFLFFDDIFQTVMLFLLGALLFKTSKTGKTLGCLILLTLSLQMILSPIVTVTFISKYEALKAISETAFSPELFSETFPFISWVARHVILVDTISDGLVNCGILFLIWLRVSKMKH